MGPLSIRKLMAGGMPGSAQGFAGLLPYSAAFGATPGVAEADSEPAEAAEAGAHTVELAANDRQPQPAARSRSPRGTEREFLQNYYPATARYAADYGVDPVLVLGLAGESGFASAGTYLRTGDAFGMTGGSTRHMTHATSPEENVAQFFGAFGDQIRGSGSDRKRFINGLQGRDLAGKPVAGWRRYNSENKAYEETYRGWHARIARAMPAFLQSSAPQ